MPGFVIRGGCILSMDDSIGLIDHGDIHVEEGRIVAVGEHLDVAEHVEVIDATDRIVLPGFVDSHRHLWQSAFRGQLASCTLADYFARIMVGLGPHVSADDVYAGTLVGSYQLLDAGITSVVDWANIINTPEHADAGIRALQESGVRAMYAYGWPGGAEYLWGSVLPHPSDVRRVAAEYFTTKQDLLTLGLGLRGAGVSPEMVKTDWSLARELDARLNVHVGLRIAGVHVKDVEVLDQAVSLGPDTTYVHCCVSTDDELRRIADTGGHVSVAAYSELVMGHGKPPTKRLMDMGVEPSLSADIVATVPGDMFSQMRTVYAEARSRAFPDDPDEPFAPAIEALDVLRFATVNGAAALGLESRIGSISPGKDADLLVLRTDRTNAIPNRDPVATVVTQMDTSNIDTVFVRGHAVKRDGALLDVDLGRLRDLAAAAQDRLNRHLEAGP